MPSGGSSPQTVTQNNKTEPWAGAQPFLKDVMSEGQSLYNSGFGFAPFPQSTVVPFSSQTTTALNNIESLAQSGNPLGQASQGAVLGLLGSGGLHSLGQQAASGLSGIGGPDAVQQNLQNYASGANVTGGSPEFLSALDTQAGRLTDDINRSFSDAGRYGSMAHHNEVIDRVGGLRTNAIAQEIARQQGMQMQAAGMLSGEQQQGIGNRLAALGTLGGMGSTANQQMGQFIGLSPGVYQQQYAPSQQLANVGSQYENLATRQLQDELSRWQQGQQEPWNLLGAYNAMINGMGSLGSQSTQSVQQPRNWGAPLGGALGGAYLGGMLPASFALGGLGGGPLGAMLGGGLGLLSMFL